MSPEQASLLDDLIDTNIATIEAELQALQTVPAATEKKQKPKRTVLPAEFPCVLIHHEPDNTGCQCGCALKRIGEDVSEKLDHTPGVFSLGQSWRVKLPGKNAVAAGVNIFNAFITNSFGSKF